MTDSCKNVWTLSKVWMAMILESGVKYILQEMKNMDANVKTTLTVILIFGHITESEE